MINQICLTFLLVTIFNGLQPINSTPRGRIIGGQDAFAGQFPWVAAIYLTNDQGNYFCGGSLFTNQFVLTAGQCVNQLVDIDLLSIFFFNFVFRARIFTILLGTHQLQGNDLTVRVATETYFLHPDFNPLTLEHDVGVIKLREPVTYSGKSFLIYRIFILF